MSEPFIGEIRIWACNFAPRGWAFCNGQLLPISQNTALFSLYGTTYGGDGRTTFAIPNFTEGRAAMHAGRGPGLTSRRLGEKGGSAAATVQESQIGSHNHGPWRATTRDVDTASPANALFGADLDEDVFNDAGNADATLNTAAVSQVGGGQAHNNVQPYQVLNFCCALTGLYPSRS